MHLLTLSAKKRLGESLDAGKLYSFCRMLEDEGIGLLMAQMSEQDAAAT